MAKRFRYLLIPFSLAYGGILWVRNRLFDKRILRSAGFNFPVICVGNLAVGGTGKTPMVEYLVRVMGKKYAVATLSRGYKRRTRGFAIADEHTTAVDIGDEPMQIHKKFPEVTVAVAEERVVGIPQVLYARPETGVIILDDAFQHREVRPGLNILLTRYHQLYTRDLLLPAGMLRDIRSSSRRAEIIVVTKCPPDLAEDDRQDILGELGPQPHQQVFFARIRYESPVHLFTREKLVPARDLGLLLLCGIADPQPLRDAARDMAAGYESLVYRDHHIFHSADLREIKKRFAAIKNENKIILTTEKDGVRLAKFEKDMEHVPIYVLPMAHEFLFDEGARFEKEVMDFAAGFRDAG